MAYNIRLRNDTRQNWLEQNPTLAQGEIAIEFQDDDRVKIKVGNGTSSYQDLPYFNSPLSYNDIMDKPLINGIEVDGNKSLIDFGIQPAGSYLTYEDAIQKLELKADKDDTYSKSEIDSFFNDLEKLPEIGMNRNMFLKIDSNGQLYWSPLSDNIYTKDEINEALANKVSKEEGYSLISDAEKERLADVTNYDDTEIKEDIEELWTDVHKKAYLDDLDNYVSQETLTTTLEDYALKSDITNKANASDLANHINNKSNPHNVTKNQIDLGNVDNTSDLDKPISNATQEALNNKQDSMEIGFGLALEEGVLKNTNPNVNADWNAIDGDSYIINKPQLSKVATSNDYNDLDNKPIIPSEYSLPIASSETLGGIKLGQDFSITEDGILQANYPGNLSDYMQLSNKPSLIVLDENNVEREYQFIPGMTKEDLDIAGHDETQSALSLKADKVDTYTKEEVDNKINDITMGVTQWGNIKGSLSAQADLKEALDSKVSDIELSRVAFTGLYTELNKKPQINSVELDGNKSLDDLGIAAKNAVYTKEEVDDKISDIKIVPQWGEIEGSLSSQTDLKNELDSKASKTDLSTVASSGLYTDLTQKPQINSVELDGNKTTSELNLVDTFSNQVIDGTKMFIGKDISTGATIIKIKNNSIERDVAPNTNQYSYIQFLDKNNIEIGFLRVMQNTNGDIVTSLGSVGKNNIGNTISLITTSNGTKQLDIPTPSKNSNNNNAITSSWFNSKMQVVSVLPVNPEEDVFYFIPEV